MEALELALLEQRLRDMLVEYKEVDQQAREAVDIVELDQTRVGRLSRMDALQAQALHQETDRRRALAVTGIRKALARIERGEYGYCLECDEEIAAARLEVNPAVELCVQCAQASEV